MEAYGADINDRSCLLSGGQQRILIDGYQLPLDFKNGLPYLRCRKPTDDKLSSLPHIIMTSDVDWDPKQYDLTFDEIEHFHDTSLTMNTKTLISMGSTDIGQLLTMILPWKNNSLMLWNTLIYLTLLMKFWILYIWTALVLFTPFILTRLLHHHRTSNCFALSLVGHPLTQLSVHLK
jgi:hypothetical protein